MIAGAAEHGHQQLADALFVFRQQDSLADGHDAVGQQAVIGKADRAAVAMWGNTT